LTEFRGPTLTCTDNDRNGNRATRPIDEHDLNVLTPTLTVPSSADVSAAGYRAVFAVPEFRVVWLAHLLSVGGDQLARVAIAVLVFDRTHSPGWTALTYAMTFLPDLVGGSVLAGLADRFPRRTVMVAADLSRGCLVAALACPGVPLVTQIGVLFGVQLLAAPFTAARTAVLPEILSGDLLTVGTGLISLTYQVALTAGLGGGGAVVAAVGTHCALWVDAATFALSGALIATGLSAHRPRAVVSGGQGVSAGQRVWWTSVRGGLRVIAQRPRARALLLIACLCGCYVVPEGLAVPYAHQIGAGTAGVGWLLAANPVGTVLGVLVLNRLRPDRRLWLLGPLAVATSLVLLPTALAPGLGVTVVLWAASGAASAHDSVTNAEFVRDVPEHARAQAVGLAVAALRAAQGVGIVVAGLLAQVLATSTVVGIAGGTGVVVGLAAAVSWTRARSSGDAEPALLVDSARPAGGLTDPGTPRT
jgi:predicted MFS family arabinose efflux permease